MCVLGGETKGCGILVVELVNMFVKQGCVEELMSCGNKEGASERAGESERRRTNRNSGTCLQRKRRMRVAGA